MSLAYMRHVTAAASAAAGYFVSSHVASLPVQTQSHQIIRTACMIMITTGQTRTGSTLTTHQMIEALGAVVVLHTTERIDRGGHASCLSGPT
jgi:hypothetical protein